MSCVFLFSFQVITHTICRRLGPNVILASCYKYFDGLFVTLANCMNTCTLVSLFYSTTKKRQFINDTCRNWTIDILQKIHCSKEHLKSSKVAKFKTDLLKTRRYSSASRVILQTFVWCGASSCPHHTNVCNSIDFFGLYSRSLWTFKLGTPV